METKEVIRSLRAKAGLSQEELAEKTYVTRQAVSRWEQGTALPDAGNLLKLRQRFGVSVDWLLEDAKGWEAQADRPVAPEASEEAVPKVRKSVLPWAIPLGISTLGLLLLGIFASVFPAEYVIGAAMEVGKEARPPEVYTGLAGFLKCNNLFWLFWLCVIVAIGSLAAGIWQAAAWNRIETEREPADGEKKE